MDTATIAIRDLEAMETRQTAVCGFGSDERGAILLRKRQRTPTVHGARKRPCDEIRISERPLRRAWNSQTVPGN
jgi:hypothetical protein